MLGNLPPRVYMTVFVLLLLLASRRPILGTTHERLFLSDCRNIIRASLHAPATLNNNDAGEYGSDSLGSGFPTALHATEPAFGTPVVAASSWNIKNVAFSEESDPLLRTRFWDNQPWLYWGMLFATFCWYV